ncbi:MAG: branched-chain amino acid ABC transporter permease [Alphaproteobacteria bacterium]|nr:branched-chain amino acid ABC transporter permease [Alphaproteobacteria bacterium]
MIWTAILIDGVVYAAWLFIVALGLTLVFGVMKILNVAHGAFYAIGAYAAASLIGVWFAGDRPLVGGYVLLVVASLAVGLVMGTLLERGVLRLVYGRDEVVAALATYAVFLILEDFILLVWGTDPYFAGEPATALGADDWFGLAVSNYDLLLVAVAAVVGLLLWLGLNRTRTGKLLLAVIHDREMSAAFGIDVTLMFTMTFVLGAFLGALGGALTAPKISVAPGIGVEVIVLAFAVVVIGGMGSIPGAVVGALIVGLARAAAVLLLPSVELFVVYAVMTLVLAFRPYGLFARAQARRI